MLENVTHAQSTRLTHAMTKIKNQISDVAIKLVTS